MPKAKLPATVSDKILTVFMQLETPVEYDAVDNKPVDIVFAVLVSRKSLPRIYSCSGRTQ